MFDYQESHFDDLCGEGRVAAAISSLEDTRKTGLKQFWLRLVGGALLAILLIALLSSPDVAGIGFFLAIAAFIGGIIFAMMALGKAGEKLKHPALEALAEKGGLQYTPIGFDPPVYADARKALFGGWLSGQTFTDLFSGTDPEGRRFAFYEGTLTRKSGKSSVVVFSGQMYAFQRRGRGGGEIVIVPDRGIFNFFKPLKGMERVKFESDAEFEKKFEVYAYQPHEALALLGSDVRRKLLELRQGGRVFGYVGPEDALIAATGPNRFEPGSMFRSTGGRERTRKMFDEVCASYRHLRDLRERLG